MNEEIIIANTGYKIWSDTGNVSNKIRTRISVSKNTLETYFNTFISELQNIPILKNNFYNNKYTSENYFQEDVYNKLIENLTDNFTLPEDIIENFPLQVEHFERTINYHYKKKVKFQ